MAVAEERAHETGRDLPALVHQQWPDNRQPAARVRRSSWNVVEVFKVSGVSGAKGRDKRSAFDRLLKAATARKIDMVAASSIDRLGRSMQHLVGFLWELQAVRVRRVRTRDDPRAHHVWPGSSHGSRRQRGEPLRLGRPPIRAGTERDILKLRAKGMGILKIAKTLGIDTSVVQRVLTAAC